jgi:ferredoxin-NADP reductase
LAGTAVLGRLTWLVAEVVGLVTETPRVRTIVLDVPGWPGHRPGQHLDVRLTAEDGYQAQRSYSIASPPSEPIAITVEVLDDGEVSPYLAEELRAGDEIEVRGPIGGYFVWEPGGEEPLLLVAGGSGIAPLMAMIRHRAATGDRTPARLVYSSRRLEEVIYAAELEELRARDDGLEVFQTLTREQPPGWEGYSRRVDPELMREVAWEPAQRPAVYVCGSTGFAEAAADALVELGHDPLRIKIERFGATGGG